MGIVPSTRVSSTHGILIFLLVLEAPLTAAWHRPTPARLLAARRHSSPQLTELVWFTGHRDLRVSDHPGLLTAAKSGEGVVPCFVLDPSVLCGAPRSALRRLQAALASLERDLADQCGSSLVVRGGDSASVLGTLARECGATVCHVVEDDVVVSRRAAQRAACTALAEQGVEVRRWSGALRERSPSEPTRVAATFTDYVAAARIMPLVPPAGAVGRLPPPAVGPLPTDGAPSLAELTEMAEAATPDTQRAARDACAPTAEPYELATAAWCYGAAARAALREYLETGRDAFADAHLGSEAASNAGAGDVGETAAPSLHAAAAKWLVEGAKPSEALSLREAASRAFAAPLALGVLSSREVVAAAHAASAAPLSPGDSPLWGRSDAGALADVAEWREWFELLAQRTLALQEAGGGEGGGGWGGGSGGGGGGEGEGEGGAARAGRGGVSEAPARGGDPREAGTMGHWRWNGQHLTRYATWPAGDEYDAGGGGGGEALPALLLVHGFAASVEQWERFVYALRQRAGAAMPPVFALDMVGFGHSEKPPLSYTQHLWEAQVADFALEVMGGRPVVLVGNSIGGGISAGVAGNLKPVCRGVVLCNTAGVLEEPDAYVSPAAAAETVGGQTRRGALPARYAPPPLVGQNGLELFGAAVIAGLFPAIPSLLDNIYGDNPANADEALAFAIEQGAASPGSANVIGSGQKLPPQRPLNEVLGSEHGFAGPVLVPQGANDRVSGPARAQERAAVFGRVGAERGGVEVSLIEAAGHCPQDDAPRVVAEKVWGWLLANYE